MNRKTFRILILVTAGIGIVSSQAFAGPSYALDPCTTAERWTFGEGVYNQWRSEVKKIVRGRIPSAGAFAQGIALRRQALTNENRYLGEYMVARALWEAKLHHIALSGFSSIASRPVTEDTVGIQSAALGCITQIHTRYPTLPLPESVAARLPEYLSRQKNNGELRALSWEFGSAYVRQLLTGKGDKADVQSALGSLSKSGAYEAFSQAFTAASRNEHKRTIESMEKFFSYPALPRSFKRYADQAHLVLARAYYSLGQYERASKELRLVRKNSNELAKTLTEISWAFLLDEKYQEAVGAALGLQAGGMRKTFAPEGPMVIAMALNEICQYPESIKAINNFKKEYEKPYKWLNSWESQQKKSPVELYPLAVSYIRKKADVPDRIATEWVRSPIFLSHQDEINLMLDQKDAMASFSRSGQQEIRSLANSIRFKSADLMPKIRAARKQMGPTDRLPGSIALALGDLRQKIKYYKALRGAAPVWKAVASKHEKQIPSRKDKLIAAINQDLTHRSERMLAMLTEIVENNQLIEVEIYHGASQDIIWQNAHPEYKDIAKKLQDEQQQAAGEKVWDWGRMPTGESEAAEIWEDEVGSFKADLYDNCSSKNKYLALKRLGVGS